jgi:hypothetical protein
MGKTVQGYSGEPREYPPPKLYYAACIGVYEIGHHEYKGKTTLKYVLDFELWRKLRSGPAPAVDSKGNQFTMPAFVGAYLGSPDSPQPANCLLACEALFARRFTVADLEAGVDMETLLRKRCKLSLKGYGGSDSVKVKVVEFLPLDDDDDEFTPRGPFHYWDIPNTDRWQLPGPDVMPCETARIFLKRSKEWLSLHPEDAPGGGGRPGQHEDDDDSGGRDDRRRDDRRDGGRATGGRDDDRATAGRARDGGGRDDRAGGGRDDDRAGGGRRDDRRDDRRDGGRGGYRDDRPTEARSGGGRRHDDDDDEIPF